ncbi:unnamed protein product, partial [marine sediment metagenome]
MGINNVCNENLPESFCWKNIEGKDYTTPAKDQGSIGSCWAFAANAAIESIIEIREDRPELNPDLSEQYLLSCLPIIQEENNVRPFFWIKDNYDDQFGALIEYPTRMRTRIALTLLQMDSFDFIDIDSAWFYEKELESEYLYTALKLKDLE